MSSVDVIDQNWLSYNRDPSGSCHGDANEVGVQKTTRPRERLFPSRAHSRRKRSAPNLITLVLFASWG
jgi:hypothetical protein